MGAARGFGEARYALHTGVLLIVRLRTKIGFFPYLLAYNDIIVLPIPEDFKTHACFTWVHHSTLVLPPNTNHTFNPVHRLPAPPKPLSLEPTSGTSSSPKAELESPTEDSATATPSTSPAKSIDTNDSANLNCLQYLPTVRLLYPSAKVQLPDSRSTRSSASAPHTVRGDGKSRSDDEAEVACQASARAGAVGCAVEG